jgi:GTP diphosphokinase / guanosine-3',5'-bis(diphosphate) 3'-diphosphatase
VFIMAVIESHPLIKSALDFARLSLAGKKRYSGELFTDHCLKVAKILEEFRITDPITLSVAILHHSLSNGAATFEDIEKEFGLEIAQMLKNLRELEVIKLTESSQDKFSENLRKMFLALARDLRIVLIKMADIYDNLQTIDALPSEKGKRLSKETLELYAPLVERLGMGNMKGEMQDLAFKFLYPAEFKDVTKLLNVSKYELKKVHKKIEEELTEAFLEEDLQYRLESRTKYLYSLFTKLKRPEVGFDIANIYDLVAFRVIVSSDEDCYKVLGLIHKYFKPMKDYVRDYIANPKTNGYQSIHTTIFGPSGYPVEVQIRTERMHEDAEYGVAAHWHYAEAKSKGVSDEALTEGVKAESSKLSWVKQLSSWQDEISDHEEFLKSVKTDFFGERIYVFTPKGDVIDLPDGATPVDFAYAVHTDLGPKASGAKVNGKLVSLNSRLSNSDVCEILVSKDKSKKPNRDWLNYVKTSCARRNIRRNLLLN